MDKNQNLVKPNNIRILNIDNREAINQEISQILTGDKLLMAIKSWLINSTSKILFIQLYMIIRKNMKIIKLD